LHGDAELEQNSRKLPAVFKEQKLTGGDLTPALDGK
jgi:hypothetical protein